MYRQKKITLCLPCRNEGAHLGDVLSSVPAIVDQIVVISNNSNDDTVRVAKRHGAEVIEEHKTINGVGYGFAHISGIVKAEGDIIVGADGDGTYPLDDLQSLIDQLLDGQLDFASCNRYPLQPGVAIPLRLRLGVWLLNKEVRLLYGAPVKDILSGMWIFRKEVADELQLTCGDWNLSPQIKINALANPRINFGELPIVQHERFGKSHQSYFKTGFSHALWIARNRFTMPLRTVETEGTDAAG